VYADLVGGVDGDGVEVAGSAGGEDEIAAGVEVEGKCAVGGVFSVDGEDAEERGGV